LRASRRTYDIYTPPLHDALPICAAARSTAVNNFMNEQVGAAMRLGEVAQYLAQFPPRHLTGGPFLEQVGLHCVDVRFVDRDPIGDRKSTRLNSSHVSISYAVFCL